LGERRYPEKGGFFDFVGRGKKIRRLTGLKVTPQQRKEDLLQPPRKGGRGGIRHSRKNTCKRGKARNFAASAIERKKEKKTLNSSLKGRIVKPDAQKRSHMLP